jgi:hypothetical protein
VRWRALYHAWGVAVGAEVGSLAQLNTPPRTLGSCLPTRVRAQAGVLARVAAPFACVHLPPHTQIQSRGPHPNTVALTPALAACWGADHVLFVA